MNNKESIDVLIISQGPPPIPGQDKVEGGGLRCWGIAHGIKSNNTKLNVTIAFNSSYVTKKTVDKFEGINVITWDMENIKDILQNYKSIVVSYCMGDLSNVVAESVRPDQQLVLDCYVPIYVEVSARDSSDIDREYNAFRHDVKNWANVLKRGDVFLCSSSAQKRFYQGVISALGRINPLTYKQDNILIVPYGIYRDEPKIKSRPISAMINNKKSNKILWFGGIYPWFDLRNLVDAVELVNKQTPTELVIVGAKNPFNSHPDFNNKYDELVDYVSSNSSHNIHFQDWVSFNQRADWYKDSDIVVVVNKEGLENEFSWRTRLVDFIWAELPILTNAGDPLGNELVSRGAAIKMEGLSPDSISKDLLKFFRSQEDNINKREIRKIKEELYWDVSTRELNNYIENGFKPKDIIENNSMDIIHSTSSRAGRLKKVVSKAKMIPSYTKRNGIRATYSIISTSVSMKLKGDTESRDKKIHFISHQLDNSGAPFVFIDLLGDLVKKMGNSKNIEFHTFNPVHNDNIKKLNSLGIRPKIYLNREISLTYKKGDVVVMNTVAHSRPMKEGIYSALENKLLNHMVWYIHEDEPELIFDKIEKKRISKLLHEKKITIYTAAIKTAQNYRKFFGENEQIKIQIYRHEVPSKYDRVLGDDSFDNILNFALPGAVADGRKGQLPVFYAFKMFYEIYYKKDPDAYRDFRLTYIGLSDDFLSRQLKLHESSLDDKFIYHGKVTHSECLDIVKTCNMTICYSMRECLPLFVFEGMICGHPILRNDSSGIEEQLVVGENGWKIESDDFDQMVKTIETVLNKSKTSNKTLGNMSKVSNKISKEQAKNSYDPMMDEIIGYFTD